MMKRTVCCWASVIFIFCFAQAAWADEISELKAQMEAMEERHQKEIMELKARIEALEHERQARIETPKETREKIAAKEEKSEEPYKGGLLTLKGERWEIGGELEFEFVDTQSHASAAEKEPHFQLDKFMLIPKVYLTDDIYLYSEIEFYSSSMLTKYIYAHFGNLPLHSFLRVGVDERFMKPSRKTERYPLAGNSFWRDNSSGIYAGGEFDPFYWRFSYSNGFEMNQRQVTEDDSLDMLHDNLRTSSYASPGEFGLGLGLQNDFKECGKIDLLGFSYFSRLSGADETFLKSNVTGYNSGKRDQYRSGINLNYSLKDLNLFTQFIKARDGDLDRAAWYIQPSYKINLADRGLFYAIEPLFRYGKLSVDIDPVITGPLTWDREEFTFALIADIYKNIKLKTEYTIDRMDKGDDIKDYGEFLTQLEVKF